MNCEKWPSNSDEGIQVELLHNNEMSKREQFSKKILLQTLIENILFVSLGKEKFVMPTTALTRLLRILTTRKAATPSNRDTVAEATVTVLNQHLEAKLPNKEIPVASVKNENLAGNAETLETETRDAVVENEEMAEKDQTPEKEVWKEEKKEETTEKRV